MNNLEIPKVGSWWFLKDTGLVHQVVYISTNTNRGEAWVSTVDEKDIIWNEMLIMFYTRFKTADPRDIVKGRFGEQP